MRRCCLDKLSGNSSIAIIKRTTELINIFLSNLTFIEILLIAFLCKNIEIQLAKHQNGRLTGWINRNICLFYTIPGPNEAKWATIEHREPLQLAKRFLQLGGKRSHFPEIVRGSSSGVKARNSFPMVPLTNERGENHSSLVGKQAVFQIVITRRNISLGLIRLRLLFRFEDASQKRKWCNHGLMGLGVYRFLTGACRNVAVCTCNYTLLGFATLFGISIAVVIAFFSSSCDSMRLNWVGWKYVTQITRKKI